MAFDLPPMTLEEAQRLYERPGIVQAYSETTPPGGLNEAQKARAQAIMDTALRVGIKAGLAWQLRNVNAAVASTSRDLETIYDFNPLMIQQRVVPAVINEARDLYNQDGDYSVRLSGALYEIQRQARFASVPPNWRGYLSFPKASFDRNGVMSMLMPSNDAERAVWKNAVKNGWDQGVEQANIMLTEALDRLNRDFVGMARFHRFVSAGKISMPAIATETLPVTKNGSTMSVDETLLRITVLPEFNSKMDRWRTTVSPSQSAAVAISNSTANDVPRKEAQ